MKNKYVYFGAVALQMVILFGMIANFQYIRYTAQTVYIEAQWYDPTDIFRWDYINLGYRLSVSPEQKKFIEDNGSRRYYIVPKIEKNIISWAEEILLKQPKGKTFIKFDSLWVQYSSQITVHGDDGRLLKYEDRSCNNAFYKTGTKVSFYSQDAVRDNLTYISVVDDKTPSPPNTLTKENTWVITNIWPCESFISLTNSDANKFFVKEGSGEQLQNKVRNHEMFAKWALGKNGSVMLEDLVEKKLIDWK